MSAVNIPDEAFAAGCNAVGWRQEGDWAEQLRTALTAAAPYLIAAELERLCLDFTARRDERDAIGDDDYDADEDECDDAGTCHTEAAVATWVRATSVLRARAAELRGETK